MHNEYGLDDVPLGPATSSAGSAKRKFPRPGARGGFGQAGAWCAGRRRTSTWKSRERYPAGRYRAADPRAEPEGDHTHHVGSAGTSFGREGWFTAFKQMRSGAQVESEDGKRVPAPDSVAAWANETGVNVMAAEGLHSKLRAGLQPGLRSGATLPATASAKRSRRWRPVSTSSCRSGNTKATWITCWSRTC
jgi:uncharacterized protein